MPAETVLVTGGSSGLGYALSARLASEGARLLWAARPESELVSARARLVAAHPGLVIDTLAIDLAEPGGPERLHRWTRELGVEVDVLVNNAGFGTYGPVRGQPAERELAMIRLNVQAVYTLTRLFLDDMVARDRGRIVNVSSTSALLPVPYMATYAATKAFVRHFSEALSDELREQGSAVTVTVVCPSAIRGTGFQQVAGMAGVRTFEGLLATTAPEVAEDALRAARHGRRVCISGRRMRAGWALTRWLPASWRRALIRREVERIE